MNCANAIARKWTCLSITLALSQVIQAQEYVGVSLPGTNISLQYSSNLVLEEPGEEPELSWDLGSAYLELSFARIGEEELEEMLDEFDGLSEIAEAKARGFGYVIEPRAVKIGNYSATEFKIVVPGYALTATGDIELKTEMHAFVMEIDGAAYMCTLLETELTDDPPNRYDEAFLQLCNSVRVQEL